MPLVRVHANPYEMPVRFGWVVTRHLREGLQYFPSAVFGNSFLEQPDKRSTVGMTFG
jgi:hypothetical protein